MSLRIARIPPSELETALDDVAQLNIAVFWEFPYLYDGDMDSERDYIAKYRDSENTIVIGAWDGDKPVGDATGTPMEDHAEEFAAPFQDAGYDLADMFCCAKSVLLPPLRGQRAGHAFFEHREANARALGRRWSCFCSVVGPPEISLPNTVPMMFFGASADMRRCRASMPNSIGKMSAI